MAEKKDNMELYNKFRAVPEEAKKPIKGGRLNGMTDISPMWRIKTLTEQFGACGEGWYYEIVNEKTYGLPTDENPSEVVMTVDIKLYYKLDNGEWSKPIYGTGGSMLMAQQSKGAYVNDESKKMALTDSISVAAKALGVGADVYWDGDNTKYNDSKEAAAEGMADKLTKTEQKTLRDYNKKYGKGTEEDICKSYNVSSLADLTKAQYAELVMIFKRREEQTKNA